MSIILKIDTTENYNLEREKNCDPCDGDMLIDTASGKKVG